jgi:hypothetical protein
MVFAYVIFLSSIGIPLVPLTLLAQFLGLIATQIHRPSLFIKTRLDNIPLIFFIFTFDIQIDKVKVNT